VATTKESPVILSLCTGLVRGLEIGIEHALQYRISVAAYAEIEAFVVENLLCGMEKGLLDVAPIWTDLKTFPFELFRGKIHGIIGGYPCQPFSVAGNQKGVDDPRHLWPYIKDGIEAIRPVFCFFENVRGHLNLGYEQVRRELQELGYEVREGIYSAEEVGAPHRRDRLFILAIRRDTLANSESVHVQGCSNGSREMQPWGSSKQLADTYNSGSRENFQSGELRTEGIEQSSCNSRGAEQEEGNERRFNSFPSRPGQYQFDWEAPRVIKPGLGCTINGYNFREDLLRGIGNGVVWQTASLAFTDLLKQF
jgi:DNA (cytosine-5)-methyltransferase 1